MLHRWYMRSSSELVDNEKRPALAGLFLVSGRQDLNLRPPGPQPGALPDCATPRGLLQAGDGNRTRPRSLEGFCATTTLRPQAAWGKDSPGRAWSRGPGGCPRRAVLRRSGALGSARATPCPGGTALVTAVTWGAYEWASSTGHSTIGMIAGIALVPCRHRVWRCARGDADRAGAARRELCGARRRDRDEDKRGGSSPGARTREDLGRTPTRRKRVAA